MASGLLRRWLMPVAAALLLQVARALSRTWRLEVVGGERLAKRGEPAIYVFWHSRLYPCGVVLYRRRARRGDPPVVMISRSRDGELGSRAISGRRRFKVVRGSSSRGGFASLRQLLRAIVEDRLSVIAVPDGPKGPPLVVKPGTLLLARKSGAPLIPMGAAANNPWRLRSWDRMMIPRPFRRLVVTVGEPYTVAGDTDIEEEAEALRRRLDRLVREAEGHLGR